MKVVGIGLNKTGTKTLKYCLEQWGFRHQSYDLKAFELYREGRLDELFDWMQEYDSFEDWPWPLFYREIDTKFPEAKFVLTVRDTPERWYRSLCKMAVRMGPLSDFEKHIYGYSMPQGRKHEHFDFYTNHNQEVEAYFAGRPDKLLKVCWDEGENIRRLAEFLNREPFAQLPPRLNVSLPVYSGDNLWRAQISRLTFQTKWNFRRRLSRLKKTVWPNRKAPKSS